MANYMMTNSDYIPEEPDDKWFNEFANDEDFDVDSIPDASPGWDDPGVREQLTQPASAQLSQAPAPVLQSTWDAAVEADAAGPDTYFFGPMFQTTLLGSTPVDMLTNGVVMFYGRTATGKSMWLQGACLEGVRATGKKVAWFDIEMGKNRWARRLSPTLGADEDEANLIQRLEIPLSMSGKVDEAQVKAWLNAMSSTEDLGLIVIDSMERLRPIAFPNSSDVDGTAISQMFSLLSNVAHHFGVPVVVIDHPAREKELAGDWEKQLAESNMRGPETKLQQADAAYVIGTVKPFKKQQQGQIAIQSRKDRDGSIPMDEPCASWEVIPTPQTSTSSDGQTTLTTQDGLTFTKVTTKLPKANHTPDF